MYKRLSDSIRTDRKSTRLNSSHLVISYAVFCLKKKVLADLIPGVGELELFEIDMVDGMAGDLVAGLRQRGQLRPGQVPGRLDGAAVDVEGRREAVGAERADPLVGVGVAVVELDGHDRQWRRVGECRNGKQAARGQRDRC